MCCSKEVVSLRKQLFRDWNYADPRCCHLRRKIYIRQWIEETEDRYVPDKNVVNEANEDEEDVQDQTSPKIKHCQAVNCITTVIQWAEENNIDLTSILTLKKIREKTTVKLHTKEKRQSKLTDFIKINI